MMTDSALASLRIVARDNDDISFNADKKKRGGGARDTSFKKRFENPDYRKVGAKMVKYEALSAPTL